MPATEKVLGIMLTESRRILSACTLNTLCRRLEPLLRESGTCARDAWQKKAIKRIQNSIGRPNNQSLIQNRKIRTITGGKVIPCC